MRGTLTVRAFAFLLLLLLTFPTPGPRSDSAPDRLGRFVDRVLRALLDLVRAHVRAAGAADSDDEGVAATVDEEELQEACLLVRAVAVPCDGRVGRRM